MDGTAIEWLIDATVAALEQGEPVDPWSLTFLLRCYGGTDRAGIRQALELGAQLVRGAQRASTPEIALPLPEIGLPLPVQSPRLAAPPVPLVATIITAFVPSFVPSSASVPAMIMEHVGAAAFPATGEIAATGPIGRDPIRARVRWARPVAVVPRIV
jgi:hypothetical protein